MTTYPKSGERGLVGRSDGFSPAAVNARPSPPITALDLLETGSGPVQAAGGKPKRVLRMKRKAHA